MFCSDLANVFPVALSLFEKDRLVFFFSDFCFLFKNAKYLVASFIFFFFGGKNENKTFVSPNSVYNCHRLQISSSYHRLTLRQFAQLNSAALPKGPHIHINIPNSESPESLELVRSLESLESLKSSFPSSVS